jgi:hypothetical protein
MVFTFQLSGSGASRAAVAPEPYFLKCVSKDAYLGALQRSREVRISFIQHDAQCRLLPGPDNNQVGPIGRSYADTTTGT